MATFATLSATLCRAKRKIDPQWCAVDLLSVSLMAKEFVGKEYFDIFTHLTVEERIVLFLLAKKLKKPATVLEVGSFLGSSATFLALGLDSKSKLFCVDTWMNDAMDDDAILRGDSYPEFRQNVAGLATKITPLRGLSAEVASSFNERIDLLFIDANHSYPGCLSDWMCWSKFLKQQAIVVFHDSGWAEGVKRVIVEEISDRSKREVELSNMYIAWL